MVLLVISVIPLGSNQPGLMAADATLVGGVALFYGWFVLRQEQKLALPLRSMLPEALLWLVVVGYSLLQAMPVLGALNPIRDRDGAPLAVPQISLVPGTTLLMTVHAFALGMLFFLAAQSSTRPSRARLVIIALFAVNVVSAGWALFSLTQLGDTLLGAPKWAYLGSATGTFVNRNTFATYCSIGLVFGAALVGSEWSSRVTSRRSGALALLDVAPYLVGSGIIFAALLASNSRLGLVAGIAGASLVALLSSAKITRQGVSIFIGILAIVAAAASLFALYGGAVLERLGSTELPYDARWDLYRQVWQLIERNPILGYGAGSFESGFPLVHHTPVSLDLVWDKAHSMYLTMWVERGVIIGSLPFIVVLILLYRLAVQYSRSLTVSPNNVAAIGAIAVVAIHSVLDFSLEIPAIAYLFSVVLGVGFGGLRQQSPSTRE